MARSLTKPLKKNLKKPLTKKLAGSTTGSKKRVQQRRQTAADRLKKPLKKPLTKPLTKPLNSRGSQKKPVNKTASKAKKLSRFGLPGKIAAAATVLGGAAFLTKKKKDPTFGEAFKKARKEKGPNSTFNYKGKKYSTVTKDQIKKAGYSTLRQYLNAGGKKKTATKPKKRKTGPRNRR